MLSLYGSAKPTGEVRTPDPILKTTPGQTDLDPIIVGLIILGVIIYYQMTKKK